jgi:hypothetical protein
MQIQPFAPPERAATDNLPPPDSGRNAGHPLYDVNTSGRLTLVSLITSELAMLAEVIRR